jgi:hypothetical protein
MHPWTMYALEVAHDREREARQDRLVALVRRSGVTPIARPSRLRRPAARALAAVSRGSASAVRRLDGRVADDLGRSLNPAD